MMNCIDKKELEQFLKGKLTPERLVAVDEHIHSCGQCKSLLNGLPNQKAELAAAVMSTYDCPEYEELSAYADKALGADRMKTLLSHINMCELCARDVSSIEEMRSHVVFRDSITVTPGMSKQTGGSGLFTWKRVFATMAGAAVLAGVALSLSRLSMAPIASNVVAEKPSTGVRQNDTSSHSVKPNSTVASNPGVVKPDSSAVTVTPVKPNTVAMLKDGPYRVMKQSDKLVLADADGAPVRSELEAKIAASIKEKLETAKIKPAKPVQLAMASINVRGSNNYVAPPTAPKQTSPMGKILLSNTPKLSWSSVELAESYRLRVFDEAGRVVIDEITSDNTFRVSEPLARGHIYSWRVGVRFSESDSWAESGAVRFKVISDDDYAMIQETKAKLPGSHIALGAAYESLGLYDNAADEYRALRRDNRDSKLAKKLLLNAVEAGRK